MCGRYGLTQLRTIFQLLLVAIPRSLRRNARLRCGRDLALVVCSRPRGRSENVAFATTFTSSEPDQHPSWVFSNVSFATG